jgi:hypothetical protein
MAADELGDLLMDRFGLHRSDVIAALKTLPAQRPWAAALTAEQARLLDASGLTDDPGAYAEAAADATATMARLYNTAYTAAEVRDGLEVSDSRVRQRRLAHTLWAIEDGSGWVYPAMQFQTVRGRLTLVRGLDDVLPTLLALDPHPAAVAGFLMTPHDDLSLNGTPTSVRDWLLHGEAIEPVLALIEIGDWAAT